MFSALLKELALPALQFLDVALPAKGEKPPEGVHHVRHRALFGKIVGLINVDHGQVRYPWLALPSGVLPVAQVFAIPTGALVARQKEKITGVNSFATQNRQRFRVAGFKPQWRAGAMEGGRPEKRTPWFGK